MRQRVVVADSGPIISLAVIDRLDVLLALFSSVNVPVAVWEEVTQDTGSAYHHRIHGFFRERVHHVQGFNELTFIMDAGESEAVMLCKELNADFLLIDDRKARRIAESLGIDCVGTLGVLSEARARGIISELRPLFTEFLSHGRYYGVPLLNDILAHHGEAPIASF